MILNSAIRKTSIAMSVAVLLACQTYAGRALATQVAVAEQSAEVIDPNTSTGPVIPSDESPHQTEVLRGIQSRWAEVYYSTLSKGQKITELGELAANIEKLRNSQPGQVELIIWHGIVLSTRAGVDGGVSALKTVKRARRHFETALELDENALNGSAHLSLGSLYYQVPPWPIGFGSKKKAQYHLKRALDINPDGIDSNFFYAGYLEKSGDLTGALKALRKALKASPRAGRKVADAGRRAEVLDAIDRIEKKTLSG